MSAVKRETSLSELADRFLLTKIDRAPRTVDTYRQTIEHHIRPKIGSLSVSEATTERLGRFISEVIDKHGPGAAKACRAVLSGMMGVAARSDAIRVNPVREIDNIARLREGAVAILLPTLPTLLAAVRADARLKELDAADVILFLVDLLRHRQARFKIRNDNDLIFPTLRGNIRDPRNTSRD